MSCSGERDEFQWQQGCPHALQDDDCGALIHDEAIEISPPSGFVHGTYQHDQSLGSATDSRSGSDLLKPGTKDNERC